MTVVLFIEARKIPYTVAEHMFWDVSGRMHHWVGEGESGL